MAVCSDPCMVAPDGRGVMRAKIAGDPEPQEWPYPCPITESGLNRDTDCLWADPIPQGVMVAAFGEQFPGVTIGATHTLNGVANLTATNPDPCRSMYFLVNVTFGFTVNNAFDPESTTSKVIMRRRVNGVFSPDPGFVDMREDFIGTTTGRAAQMRTTWFTLNVGAGGSANLSADMQVARTGGDIIWTRASALITAMAVGGD